jgi:hypothetical protein
MKMEFENTANGYVEEVDGAWFYMLIFGFFYLGYKGAWMAAILALVGAMLTAGISWLFLPIFADEIIRKSYLQRGWKELTPPPDDGPPPKPKKRSAEHERKLAEAKKKMGW